MMQTPILPAAELVSILGVFREPAIEKLTKLAKRAARYGQAITWTEARRVVTVERPRWDGKLVKIDVEYIDLAITGAAPKVGDFKFLATLEREPGGVLISAVPGVEIGDFGRAWDGRCDHCGSNRARRTAFVVEDASGRKIVGRSCLRDHMGMDAPAGLMQLFTYFRSIIGLGDDEPGWFGSGRWQDSTLGVVAASRAAIALWGWRPKSAEGMSTGAYVGLLTARLDPKNDRHLVELRDQLNRELRERGDHYQTVAEQVIDWGHALKPRGDYEHNLKVALASQSCGQKTWGLVVSAAAAFDRQVAVEEKRKAEAAAAPASYHFGEIGKRTTANVTIERVQGLPDYGYGPSILYVLREDGGALLSWKTSPDTDTRIGGQRVEVGTKAVATFTPKEHTEFRGQPETRIKRCKLAALPTN